MGDFKDIRLQSRLPVKFEARKKAVVRVPIRFKNRVDVQDVMTRSPL